MKNEELCRNLAAWQWHLTALLNTKFWFGLPLVILIISCIYCNCFNTTAKAVSSLRLSGAWYDKYFMLPSH